MSADMFRMAWFAGTSTAPPAWNKPWSPTNGRTWARPDFHIDLARALERGGFDDVMIEDGSFISDSYGGNPDAALRNAWAVPKNDPIPYVPLIAEATRHIGIVATAATTFYPPFMAARLRATLDHLTEGRFGFNLVTAHNDRSAQNDGLPHVPEQATRYEMASEWVDVVGALWNSWEPGAIVDDREGGSFVDPSKVHPIEHEGRFFNCRGPLNTAPGPQRRPVLCQAGGSGSGMAFAATYVDTIIAAIADAEEARTYRRQMDELLLAAGRSPKDIKIFFSVSLVISDSDEEARERRRLLDETAMADIARRLFEMSYATGLDFSRFELDETLPPLATSASTSIADRISKHADLTLREIASRPHGSGIPFTGTPETIAARMDEVMQETDGDGFLVNELPTRRIVAEIADGLCPALQRRGLIRRDYPTARSEKISRASEQERTMADGEDVQRWDVIVAGAGTAGIMAAIFAGQRGARVLLIEAAPEIGGTLHIAGGMISAAGTKWQAEYGIVDSPEEHYEDVMRICQDTADPKIVRLAVEEAAKTFDWLTDHGLQMSTPKPVVGAGIHESYRTERYGWGTEHGISILKIVRPQLMAQVAQGRVDLRLRTRLTGLVRDETTGRIEGIRCVTEGGAERIFIGSNIVLATGGFGASAEMVQEIHHTPMYMQGAWRHDTGDGIKAGLAVGGVLRNTGHYLGNFGCVLTSSHYPSEVMATPVTSPKRRQPWEIYVSSTGRRFVNECEPSVDKREHALVALPDKRYWIVFDQEILEHAPPMIPEWRPEDFRGTFGNHEMFLKADTLAELAAQAGMEPVTLTESVDDYNATLGGEDRFGRPHRPRPISRGPFYAVRMHCTPITSNPGLDVDDELRALDASGAPIPGLYLAGEVIGASATMGQSAVNGMLLTPAMAFGRLLGERLLTWPQVNATRGESLSMETASP